MEISSIKISPFRLPIPKPLSPSPPLFPFNSPLIPSIRAPKTLTHAFYTERTPISAPRPKPKNPNTSDPDDIAVLNERIRRELGKRERSKGGGGQELDSKEAEKYIKLVKQQQQRGLQKLKGDIDGKGSGFGYRVDPYTLRPGDYVVHKKVGIGKFVAIKYDVSAKEGSAAVEPVEYVFIEYGDGMAKLPVKQAAKMLYRYNLPNETNKPRTLSKLNDTRAWEKRRIKGKIAIQKMVVDLMELYLHRLKQKRPPYPKNPAMAEFAALFPFEPTPDQKQAISLYLQNESYLLPPSNSKASPLYFPRLVEMIIIFNWVLHCLNFYLESSICSVSSSPTHAVEDLLHLLLLLW